MGFIKDKINRFKQDRAANKIIEKKAHAAYLRAKEKQEFRVQEARAKQEADSKISRMKEKHKPLSVSKSGSRYSGSLFGKSSSHFNPMGESMFFKPKPEVPQPNVGKKQKGKTITIHL